MIKLEDTEVLNLEGAVRGLRNPMNSWDKSDSYWGCRTRKAIECGQDCYYECCFNIGDNDLTLMKKLAKAGSDHRKFMRQIFVSVDITCHHTWWAEFDTYKVGTVRNSCSKMHKIHVKEFDADNFSTEGIQECGGSTVGLFLCVLTELEGLRRLFNETHEKKYWRAIIELLPMGYNIKATVTMNYEVLRNMYHARKNHKLDEWREFCGWIEGLPYSEIITGKDE